MTWVREFPSKHVEKQKQDQLEIELLKLISEHEHLIESNSDDDSMGDQDGSSNESKINEKKSSNGDDKMGSDDND